ncbi:hypothetical protein MMC25_004931 [Agyrium rufum]|nr:hypothetical protein [Agyrium rufum]
MNKNPSRNITDFFKPYARPRESGVPSPATNSKNGETVESLDSSHELPSPPLQHTAPNQKPVHLIRSSSLSPATSSISPSPTSESTPEPPVPAPLSFNDGRRSTSGTQRSDPTSYSFSSSQRIIRNGEHMVTNSDGDTDSGGSLEDLDEILGVTRTKAPIVPEPAEQPTSPIKGQSTVLPILSQSSQDPIDLPPARSTRSYQKKARTRSHSPAKPKPRKPPKFSLEELLAQAQADEALEAKANQAQSALSDLDREQAEREARQRQILQGKVDIDNNVYSSVRRPNGDENGEGEDRLAEAIAQSEAALTETSWSFFEEAEDVVPFHLPELSSLQTKCGWISTLKDPVQYDHAFTTGFMSAQAAKSRIPMKVFSWLLDAVCVEASLDRRQAYVSTLVAGGRQAADILDEERLHSMFSLLGSKQDASDVTKPVRPVIRRMVEDAPVRRPRDFGTLISVLSLLDSLASDIHWKVRNQAVSLVCRLRLDESVRKDRHVLVACEDALIGIFETIKWTSVDKTLSPALQSMYNTIKDPSYQLLLLQSIPATSILLALFRRRLALAYLFSDETYLTEVSSPLTTSESLFSKINALLTSESNFAINRQTDYALLAIRTSILNIAIGDADPPLPPSSPSPPSPQQDHPITKQHSATPAQAPSVSDSSLAKTIPNVNAKPPQQNQQQASATTTNKTPPTPPTTTPSTTKPPSTFTPSQRSRNANHDLLQHFALTDTFNASVDALAQRIKALADRIVDSVGDLKMVRAEAKTALEALHMRFVWSVRTEVRARKGVFDGPLRKGGVGLGSGVRIGALDGWVGKG